MDTVEGWVKGRSSHTLLEGFILLVAGLALGLAAGGNAKLSFLLFGLPRESHSWSRLVKRQGEGEGGGRSEVQGSTPLAIAPRVLAGSPELLYHIYPDSLTP